MTRKKVIIPDIERINDLLRIKKLIYENKIIDWEHWSFIKFNVWDFNENDAIERFGKNECLSNERDYDYEYESKYRTAEEMEQHRTLRGAENLVQNEFDRYGDYRENNNSQDSELLEYLKDALYDAGYIEGMQLEGIEF